MGMPQSLGPVKDVLTSAPDGAALRRQPPMTYSGRFLIRMSPQLRLARPSAFAQRCEAVAPVQLPPADDAVFVQNAGCLLPIAQRPPNRDGELGIRE